MFFLNAETLCCAGAECFKVCSLRIRKIDPNIRIMLSDCPKRLEIAQSRRLRKRYHMIDGKMMFYEIRQVFDHDGVQVKIRARPTQSSDNGIGHDAIAEPFRQSYPNVRSFRQLFPTVHPAGFGQAIALLFDAKAAFWIFLRFPATVQPQPVFVKRCIGTQFFL